MILPENENAIELFLNVQTQWNTSVGGITGLNYASVLAVINIFGYDDSKAVFSDLQVMEITALQIFNKTQVKNNA